MSGKEFIKSLITSYFTIVTLVTLLLYVSGTVLRPDQQFGYEAFSAPLLYGLLGIIPAGLMYSKKELSVKQFWIRKVLQFISVVVLLLLLGYGVDNINEAPLGQTMIFVLSVAVIFILTNLVFAFINTSDAKKMDKLLQEYKSRE